MCSTAILWNLRRIFISTSPPLPLSAVPRSNLRFRRNRIKLISITNWERKSHSLKVVQSVLNACKLNDNGASEEAKMPLERLFAQTQRLGEHVSKDPHFPQDAWLGLCLNPESDLQAALAVLKKKEEDLQDAERTISLERSPLNNAREKLEKVFIC